MSQRNWGPVDVIGSFMHESELYAVSANGTIWRWDEQSNVWLRCGRFSRDEEG